MLSTLVGLVWVMGFLLNWFHFFSALSFSSYLKYSKFKLMLYSFGLPVILSLFVPLWQFQPCKPGINKAKKINQVCNLLECFFILAIFKLPFHTTKYLRVEQIKPATISELFSLIKYYKWVFYKYAPPLILQVMDKA